MGKVAQHRSSRKRSPNPVVKWVNTPKGFVFVVLVAMAAVAILAAKGIDMAAARNVLISVATGFAVDLVVGLFYKRKRFVSDGGMVTGLIVAMVLGSFSPWYVAAGTTAIALVSKHVLRLKRKPLFNPAAFGLLISNYVFVSMQSWWGGMSLVSAWYLIVLAIAGILVTWRVRKFPQVIAFLATYVILCLGLMLFNQTSMDAQFALENPMLNSAIFFAFFMTTDPPTSPTRFRDQTWFGCLTGAVSVGVYMFFPSELTYLLIGLLAANAIKFIQFELFKSSARSRAKAVQQHV